MNNIVPELDYTYLIGFRSADEDKVDDYFDRFCYENKNNIRTRGNSFIILNDGTKIKKIHTTKANRLHSFDQYILADNANGLFSRVRYSYLTKGIKWSNRIPEEYRIIYLDMCDII